MMSKKKILIGIVALGAVFLLFRACGSSPQAQSRDLVSDFVTNLKDHKPIKAIRKLDPSLRENLEAQVKLPLALVELKPYEALGATLEGQLSFVKSWKIKNVSKISDSEVKVVLETKDNERIERDITFTVSKEDDSWKISAISF
jgi:hypothetical protein